MATTKKKQTETPHLPCNRSQQEYFFPDCWLVFIRLMELALHVLKRETASRLECLLLFLRSGWIIDKKQNDIVTLLFLTAATGMQYNVFCGNPTDLLIPTFFLYFLSYPSALTLSHPIINLTWEPHLSVTGD